MRHRPTLRPLRPILLLLATTGCFGSDGAQEHELCGPNGECPGGFQCNPSDNRCYADGEITIDRPDTSITQSPPVLDDHGQATFAFSSTKPGSSYQCRLDGGAFRPCNTPFTTTVAEGAHTLEVFAVDASGLRDDVPAVFMWTVDLTPPDTRITAAPAGSVNTSDANLTFTATEAGTFRCSLDSAPPTTCPTPLALTGLAPGPHNLQVAAVDAAGNVDPTPAIASWSIDLTGPTTTLAGTPADTALVRTPAASFTFTASEAVRGFACSRDGGAFAACTSPQSYNATGDGAHSFAVRATDLAGNEGPTARRSWSLDTVGPTVTLTGTPAEGATTKNRAVSLTFTASETGSTFACSVNGGAFAACTSPQSYSEAGADGAHTFAVRATDRAGNTGATATRTFTLDTTGPTTTLTGTPADGASVNSRAASFSFTSEAGATFGCSVDGGAYAACTSPQGYTVAGADGAHSFAAFATDVAGNAGPVARHAFTLDTTGAVVSLAGTPANGALVATRAASFTFTSEAGAVFECSRDGAAYAACASPQSYTLPSDGAHSFAVRARDTLGNTGAAVSRSWSVDTVAPTVTIGGTPANGAAVASRSVSLTLTPSESGATLHCTLNGAGVACGATYTAPVTADGAYSFAVYAVDAAGNTGPAASRAWSVDTTGPSVSISGTPANGALTNNPAVSFTLSSEAGASFQCSWNGSAWSACVSPYALTFTSGGANDGGHTFYARATDTLGNVGAAASTSFALDTVAPTAYFTLSTPAYGALVNSGYTFYAFGASEANVSYQCWRDGGAIACNGGTYDTKTFAQNGSQDGYHDFYVRAIDAAGNAGPWIYTYLTLDTVAPAVWFTSGPASSSTNPYPVFGFASNDSSATFWCVMDSGTYQYCGSGTQGSYSSPGVGEGTHVFWIESKDAAGNYSIQGYQFYVYIIR